MANIYSNAGGDMKQYHHPHCLFETFLRARATTRIIQDPDDIHGYEDLTDEDQKMINDLIDGTWVVPNVGDRVRVSRHSMRCHGTGMGM